MIQLDDVSKIYQTKGKEVRALDGLSLSVDRGEFVAVRGPSGCGKSTLLSVVGGLAAPTSGRATVAGASVSDLSPSERARFRGENVGFVFQMFHLLPYLNVLDNVVVAGTASGSESVQARASSLLEQFGLAERMRHHPGQLSAGERQRVAMARALLNQPKLLLADEPTGNLDPANADVLLDLLADFHATGGTILLVTHDDRASARADRIVSMERGKLAI